MPEVDMRMRPPMGMEPKTSNRVLGSKPETPNKIFRWLMKFLLTVVIVVVILGAVWFVWGKNYWFNSGISKGYQAVFLTNGQVYFGKLQTTGNWVTLKDIYYLQVTQELQPASNGSATPVPPAGEQSQPAATPSPPSVPTAKNTNNRLQLVKLGSELHGPEDIMYIAKDKVLFWENMKSDSQVMQAIKDYQAKQ